MRTAAVFVTIFAAALCGCSEDCSECWYPLPVRDLVVNPSFEGRRAGSIYGWELEEGVRFVFTDDVPSGGGDWSIALDAATPPGLSLISQDVPAVKGERIYEFSFFARREGPAGIAKLVLERDDVTLIRRIVGVTSSYWTYHAVLDTIDALPGDTISIQLDGGYSEIVPGRTWFDEVHLLVR